MSDIINIKYLHSLYTQAIAPGDAKKVSKTHYAFVIDESGSIGSTNYRIITKCCTSQVAVMDLGNQDQTAPNAVTIFRFDTVTKHALPLTSKREDIIKTLRELPYSGGGTDTAQALTQAYYHLKSKNSLGVHNVIILMTDDAISGAKTIINTINKDTSISIRLVVIFMNISLPPNIHKETTLEPYQIVHFNNFTVMEDTFQYFIHLQEFQKPTFAELVPSTNTLKISLIIENPFLPVDFYQVILLDEFNEVPLKELKTQYGELLISGLEADKVYRIKACVQYINGIKSGYCNLEKFSIFSRKDLIQTLSDPEKLKENHAKLIKSLPRSSVPKRLSKIGFKKLNTLIMGIMGHGKSSFVCTCASTFEGKYKIAADTASNPFNTVTTEYSEVKIIPRAKSEESKEVSKEESKEESKGEEKTSSKSSGESYLRFLDTFGIRFHKTNEKVKSSNSSSTFEDSNFAECLDLILKGNIRPGYKEWTPIEDAPKISTPTINEMIHAVAFIVDVIAIKQESQLKIIEEFIKKLSEKFKIKPLVIFTKCDQVMEKKLDAGRKPQLKDIWNDSELLGAIDFFLLHVPYVSKEDIMLFSNYTDKYTENERDFAREYLNLNIIETLKQRGEAFVNKQLKNFVRVIDQNDVYLGKFEFKYITDNINDYETKIENIVKEERTHNYQNYQIIYQDNNGKEKLLIRERFADKQLHDVLFEEGDDEGHKLKISIPEAKTTSAIPTQIPLFQPSGKSLIKSSTNANIQSSHSFTDAKRIQEIELYIDGEEDGLEALIDINPNMSLQELRNLVNERNGFPAGNFYFMLPEDQIPVSSILRKDDTGSYSLTLVSFSLS